MIVHRIISDGLGIYVRETGHGLPLVLIHGMWCDHRMFDALCRWLPDSFKRVSIDLRGHGKSQAPRQRWSVMDVARDIETVMAALALKPAVLIGHSLGGMAALHVALDSPDLTHALVLIGTSADQETPERKSQLETLSLTVRLAGLPRWMIRRGAEMFFTPAFLRNNISLVDEWCSGVRYMKKRALIQALHAIKERPSIMPRLAEIRIPVLSVCGSSDTIADPVHSTVMARRLPKGDHVIIAGTGHALPFERPRELAARIGRFLSSNHLSDSSGTGAL